VYNFAFIPHVHERDEFWHMKFAHHAQGKAGDDVHYQDIHLPKNTASGIYTSAFIFLFGFAMVWQIIWLAAVCLIGAIVCFIIRSLDENTEYVITAEEVKRMESKFKI